MWKAIRAVTVETTGIVAVVWILFTGVGWTVQTESEHHASVQPKAKAERALQWLNESTGEVVEALKPPLDQDERSRYVEDRLGYYSEIYRDEAGAYIQQAARGLADQFHPDESRRNTRDARRLFSNL